MRIVFMGTAEFGIPSLKILLENQHLIVGVVTVADKPAGRGQRLHTSPIKKFAIEHHLQILQPTHLHETPFVESLNALHADIFIVVAFRILPPAIFTLAKYGAVNLHASLLPQYRGAAPINWAMINGETETGVTTFFLSEQVDTGNIILQARVPIGENEIAGELHDRL
ncbi:MAG TPA: methionyl-tRNA formyltransferase, partial [Bacteroidota bacterium]|nr:methionyl-tRNA formyltransferase [Bacteroidota bacterium]